MCGLWCPSISLFTCYHGPSRLSPICLPWNQWLSLHPLGVSPVLLQSLLLHPCSLQAQQFKTFGSHSYLLQHHHMILFIFKLCQTEWVFFCTYANTQTPNINHPLKTKLKKGETSFIQTKAYSLPGMIPLPQVVLEDSMPMPLNMETREEPGVVTATLSQSIIICTVSSHQWDI